ncbi:methyl-accepting chemotaxis protein [Photobacterium lipolyticum]|uniref:Methyl-accepting chemotaxis protein n=1 Tax=Photobacterium lipolyticum TaxID=266810 RepID=A0A2T3N0Y2_9GAMM|nr:methyl-accepting chemotaxis protein [Photobacterium lipolyticum]PSW05980.1 methyl-accepting chemotaxis protein [Photobacterium lipolyticum]
MSLTLKTKLVLASVVAITVTAVSFGIVSYSEMKQEAWRAIESESTNTAQAHAMGIGDWILGKRHAIEGLKEAIENDQSLDIVSHLKQTYKSGGFGLSYYGNAKGEMFRQDPSLNTAGYDPRTRGWYKQAFAADNFITTKPYVSHTMNALVVTMADPVRNNGKVIGVAASNLALDKLTQDVISMPVLGEGYAMLLDNSGIIVAHPNKDLVLKDTAEIGQGFALENLRREMSSDSFFKTTIDGQEMAVKIERIPNTTWLLAFVMDIDVLEAPLRNMVLQQMLFGLMILLAMGGGTAWFVNRQLAELAKVSDALSDIAHGDGDLTVSISTRSDDEVGKLASNFNVFVARLHQMVTRLSEITVQLNDQAKVTSQAAAARHENIRLQQDEITMVATAVTEMASATQEIAGNAENTAKTSTQAVTLSSDGYDQVNKSQSSIGELEKEVTNAVGIIEELNGHAQQISTILATIRSIAEQTNLLALNAAIEAARAGEQGRGFAVVADEVRVLSQRTHSSTEEIQQMIETLQSTTQRAVSVMSDSHQLAATSVDDVDEAGSSLERISHAISEISDMATQIASAAEEQSSVTSEISRNTEGVKNVADNLAEESLEAAKQAEELNVLASELGQEVGRFKL